MFDQVKCVRTITAVAVLYNMCIRNRIQLPVEDEIDEEAVDEEAGNENGHPIGRAVRDNVIAQYLYSVRVSKNYGS